MAVTRKDVAKLARVSEATVSYVINNTKNITPEVKKRVLDAVEQLEYRPNMLAKSLVTKQTRHVAMIIDNIQNPYYCRMMEGVQHVAEREGYIVSVLSAAYSEKQRLFELLSRGVEGVILAMGAYDTAEFAKLKLPMIAEGGVMRVDYSQAILDMVKMLKENGHKKIALLSGLPLNREDHVRYRDFLAALKQCGIPPMPQLYVDGNDRTDEEAGYLAMSQLLEKTRDFTAVFAINDLMATGAKRRLWECGMRIPEDVSLVGCDGNRNGVYWGPALSTINAHGYHVGQALMKSLIVEIHPDRADYKKEWVIEAEFLNRETIGVAREK